MKSVVEVTINDQQMAAIRRKLAGYPKAAPKLLVASINKTAAAARRNLAKAVSSAVALPQKAVAARARMSKATRFRLAAGIYIDNSPLTLSRFSTRQTKRGVSYMISRNAGRQLLESAFIQTANNAKLVWKRRAPGDDPAGRVDRHAGAAPNVKRYPIAVQRGPGIGEIYHADPMIATRIQKEASENLLEHVDAAIKRYLWARQKFGKK